MQQMYRCASHSAGNPRHVCASYRVVALGDALSNGSSRRKARYQMLGGVLTLSYMLADSLPALLHSCVGGAWIPAASAPCSRSLIRTSLVSAACSNRSINSSRNWCSAVAAPKCQNTWQPKRIVNTSTSKSEHHLGGSGCWYWHDCCIATAQAVLRHLKVPPKQPYSVT